MAFMMTNLAVIITKANRYSPRMVGTKEKLAISRLVMGVKKAATRPEM